MVSSAESLQQHISQASKQGHRALVVIQGSKEWVFDRYLKLRPKLITHGLVINNENDADAQQLASSNDQVLNPKQYKQTLGTQVSLLVWNLFEQIHPDALAASSGALRSGGLLIVLKPDTQPESRFKQRLFDAIDLFQEALFFNQSNDDTPQTVSHWPDIEFQHEEQAFALTQEQKNAVNAIQRVVKGHRKRPLIIHADRGRGKSTVLGYSAAVLVEEAILTRIILVSNNQSSIAILKQHFAQQVTQNAPHLKNALEVWPSDRLLSELPETNLLLVDEAASLPLATIQALLSHYSRVVFASTLHGYEGSGRGFELKLQGLITKLNQQAHHTTLSEAIRWSSSDPLEAFCNHTFMLNAEPSREEPMHSNEQQQTIDPKQCSIRYISSEKLADDETLLREVFALLVLAHYQTRPSDLALILDGEGIELALVEHQQTLCGVVLLVKEGAMLSQQTEQDIIAGKKRLKGALISQSLAQFYNDPHWLKLNTLRVMRIVVKPEYQAQGLGSFALKHLKQEAACRDIQALSVSYGIEPRLMRFWQQHQFHSMRLGYKADASSGAASLMMIAPLTDQAEALVAQHQGHFYKHFCLGLSRYHVTLDCSSALAILRALPSNKTLESKAVSKLRLFANERYALFDTWVELKDLLLCSVNSTALDDEHWENLIAFILMEKQLQDFAPHLGKKAWENLLRDSVAKLLSLETRA